MSNTVCKHGTHIGHPGGPDFMCGWCEDGTSDREFAEWIAGTEARRTERALAKVEEYDKVARVLREVQVPWTYAVQGLEAFANSAYFADTRRALEVA